MFYTLQVQRGAAIGADVLGFATKFEERAHKNAHLSSMGYFNLTAKQAKKLSKKLYGVAEVKLPAGGLMRI